MSSSSVKKMDGYVARGGEAPFQNPNSLLIVGLDVPETASNWFAHCARLKDEADEDLADYVAAARRSSKIDDPIDVYKDGTRYVVLDGRRSTRVARIIWAEQAAAGVPEGDRISVRVLLRQGTPEELYRYNVDSHKKKPLTPSQEARTFLIYYEQHGQDAKRTAEFFEVTAQTVRNKLAVFDFSPRLCRAYDAGFPLREAIELSKEPRDKQDEILEQLEAAGALRGARAANGIRAAKRGEEIQATRARARSRVFLEKWAVVLKKKPRTERAQVDPVDFIRFILGGPVPRDAGEDFRESLVEAGCKLEKRS